MIKSSLKESSMIRIKIFSQQDLNHSSKITCTQRDLYCTDQFLPRKYYEVDDFNMDQFISLRTLQWLTFLSNNIDTFVYMWVKYALIRLWSEISFSPIRIYKIGSGYPARLKIDPFNRACDMTPSLEAQWKESWYYPGRIINLIKFHPKTWWYGSAS